MYERQSKKKQTNKQTNKGRKEERGDTSFSETVRTKWFCCAFKLGFLQLMCNASLIFKSNLELAISITLKEIRNKACCSKVLVFKNMRFVVLFHMFVNPIFKMMTNFTNVARTTASTSTFFILGNISSYQEFGLYMENNF